MGEQDLADTFWKPGTVSGHTMKLEVLLMSLVLFDRVVPKTFPVDLILMIDYTSEDRQRTKLRLMKGERAGSVPLKIGNKGSQDIGVDIK